MKTQVHLTIALCLFALTHLNAQQELQKGPDPQTTSPPAITPQLPPNAKTTASFPKEKGTEKSNVTPFDGHIDVDINAFKPGLSMQNLDATTATWTNYWNDLGTYFALGIGNSAESLADVPGPNMAFLSLGSDLGFMSNISFTELMRLQVSTGALGIGTNAPATNTKLHVVQTVDNPGVNGTIYGEFAGPANSLNDTPALLGKNSVDDYYGIGVQGQGGWKGVEGTVAATGAFSYYGVIGNVTGGTGTNYGVYGYAGGGSRQYAVYGVGNVKVASGRLLVNTTTTQEDATPNYELVVDGEGIMEELRVKNSTNWPDYVFDQNYSLMPIAEMEQFIAENGHLPGVPSAKEIQEQGGSDVGQMQKILLEKVEQLSLYVIELKKENEELRQMVEGKNKRKKDRRK